MRRLEEAGLLIVVAEANPGKRRAREYRLIVPTPALAAPLHEVHPRTTCTPAHDAPTEPPEESITPPPAEQPAEPALQKAPRKTRKRRDEPDEIEHQFDGWFQHYPVQVGRVAALKAYRAALKKTDQITLLSSCMAYAAKVEAENTPDQYIKSPANWLNDGYYLNKYSPNNGVRNGKGNGHNNLFAAAQQVSSQLRGAAAAQHLLHQLTDGPEDSDDVQVFGEFRDGNGSGDFLDVTFRNLREDEG
jgi:hypothetical protein